MKRGWLSLRRDTSSLLTERKSFPNDGFYDLSEDMARSSVAQSLNPGHWTQP